MSTIVTRSGKGSPLTNTEVDANFTNLNTGKAELSGATFTGEIVAPSLDISGNIDVDGVTNLDVVDIDGAVDMASTLAVGGVVTANAGVVVDTITIDGSTITSSGSLTLDLVGNLTIDVDGTVVSLSDGGVNFGQLFNTGSGNFNIYAPTSNKDMIFRGNDGGSGIVALTLDMSAAGKATFNSGADFGADTQVTGIMSVYSTNLGAVIGSIGNTANDLNIYSTTSGHNGLRFHVNGILPTDNGGTIIDNDADLGDTSYRFKDLHLSGSIKNTSDITLDAVGDIILDADGGDIILKDAGSDRGRFDVSDNFIIKSQVADKDIIFQGNDAGIGNITALTLDMSAAGAATFNSSITIPDWVYHSGDSNTYFGFPSGDEFKIVTGNTGRLHIKGSESVWNEGGEDKDFRVESDGNANMLFVDGGNNRVIVGAAGGLTSTFNVSGNAQFSNGTGNVGSLSIAPSNDRQLITANSPGNYGDYGVTLKSMRATGGSTYINNIDMTYQGTVLNEEGLDLDFRVESNDNANMLFVDGGNNHIGMGTATLNRSGLGTDHICLTVGADNQMGMIELQGTRTSNADLGRVSFLNAGTRRAEIVAARIDADNSTKLYFQTSNAGSLGTRLTIGKDGAATFASDVLPATNGTQDLGSTSLRWANVYTGDLHLSNEEKGGNEMDGTTGNWTIQEGAENLYIKNNKTGKQYKFALEEIV